MLNEDVAPALLQTATAAAIFPTAAAPLEKNALCRIARSAPFG